MIEVTEKNDLAQRTRGRSARTWVPMDVTGALTPLQEIEAERNALALPSIEMHMDVADAEFTIKEAQRDKTRDLSMEEIDQERIIIDMKAANERYKLSVKHATTEYTLAVQNYEAKIKENLMGVKEYAALVEREALAASLDEAILAVDKEALRLAKTEAEIFKEYLARAMVESDIAKAKVDVAKANVRALEADLAAGEAEIKLVDAEIKEFMAVAEKASLQADVARIFAEIMTKELSTTKLAVGRAEIVAGYGYVQSKLDDMVRQYDLRVLMEQLKAEAETTMAEETSLLVAAELDYELLKERDADLDLQVQTYNREQTELTLSYEATLKKMLVAAHANMNAAKNRGTHDKETAQTASAALVSAAQIYTYLHQLRGAFTFDHRKTTSTEVISGK